MVTQEEIRARIAALKDRVSRIRTVKYGDYVLSSDFNEVASCLAEAADILSKLPLTKEIVKEIVKIVAYPMLVELTMPAKPITVPETPTDRAWGELVTRRMLVELTMPAKPITVPETPTDKAYADEFQVLPKETFKSKEATSVTVS